MCGKRTTVFVTDSQCTKNNTIRSIAFTLPLMLWQIFPKLIVYNAKALPAVLGSSQNWFSSLLCTSGKMSHRIALAYFIVAIVFSVTSLGLGHATCMHLVLNETCDGELLNNSQSCSSLEKVAAAAEIKEESGTTCTIHVIDIRVAQIQLNIGVNFTNLTSPFVVKKCKSNAVALKI